MRKRSLTSAVVALFFLTFAFIACACQSAPSENRATSGEASAAAVPVARESQPHNPDDTRASSSDRYDLARDENRGGHTLDKHVGQTDDELRQRLERERDISAASTWTDLTAAEATVATALRANQSKLDRWNERGYPRTNLALHFDAGHAIGRTMRHGQTSSEPCSGAVVVLKADHDGGFFVLTTYPEDRE